jgi:hypothetical protein
MIGYLKKILLILLIILSHFASKTALSLTIFLYSIQFFISVKFRPFIFSWVGILKSLGDLLDLIMIILMLATQVLRENWLVLDESSSERDSIMEKISKIGRV